MKTRVCCRKCKFIENSKKYVTTMCMNSSEIVLEKARISVWRMQDKLTPSFLQRKQNFLGILSKNDLVWPLSKEQWVFLKSWLEYVIMFSIHMHTHKKRDTCNILCEPWNGNSRINFSDFFCIACLRNAGEVAFGNGHRKFIVV